MSGEIGMEMADNEKGYGEPLRYDPQFRGPMARRGCTDVICLLLFFFFLIGWGFGGYYAYREGDLNRLLVPRDTDGLKCGVDSEVKDKPYLVFFDLAKCADPLVPISGCPTPQACVKECPKETFIYKPQDCQSQTFEVYNKKLVCSRHVKMNNCADVDKYMQNDQCARWYLKSYSLSNRCIPLDPEDVITLINQNEFIQAINNIEVLATINGMGQLIVEDTRNIWPVLAVALVIAALVSLIFIAIMRWLAAPIIWLSIVGVIALLSGGSYYSYTQYAYFKANPVERSNFQPNLKSFLNSYFAKADTWLYLLIGLVVVLVVIMLLVLVFRKRIVIAIALVKEGSKAVSSNLSTILFPIFPWILQLFVIVFGLMVFLYLSSVGEPEYKITGLKNETYTNQNCECTGAYLNIKDGDLCDPLKFNQDCHVKKTLGGFFGTSETLPCSDAACHFIKIASPPLVTYFQGVNLVGFFWMIFFISAFGEMVLAATFATWYWTFNKTDVPYFTLTGAFYRTVRYHLGTLAFGALIITICRLIRLVLEYIDRKLKKFDNELTKAILCCCKCFFWCLENFLKFMNRNAYIMTAIHGKNFCASSKDAFNLLMRNVLRVIALDNVSDFLFFLSKLLISLGMSASLYVYLISDVFHQHFPGMILHYELGPVFIIFVGTYLISSVFFGVYSMAVDTLFLCFLEDSERNDGSPDRPYFMSKQLMKILGKKNK